jgi:hypothetical protein
MTPFSIFFYILATKKECHAFKNFPAVDSLKFAINVPDRSAANSSDAGINYWILPDGTGERRKFKMDDVRTTSPEIRFPERNCRTLDSPPVARRRSNFF